MDTSPNEIGTEAQQFSRITLATTILFVSVTLITATLGFVFDSPIARGLAYLWGGLLLPITIFSHYAALRGHLDRAVGLVSTVWYLIALCMIMVGERMYGVMIVTATLPILMVLPFASQAMFRRLIVGSILLIAAGTLAVTVRVASVLVTFLPGTATSALNFALLSVG